MQPFSVVVIIDASSQSILQDLCRIKYRIANKLCLSGMKKGFCGYCLYIFPAYWGYAQYSVSEAPLMSTLNSTSDRSHFDGSRLSQAWYPTCALKPFEYCQVFLGWLYFGIGDLISLTWVFVLSKADQITTGWIGVVSTPNAPSVKPVLHKMGLSVGCSPVCDCDMTNAHARCASHANKYMYGKDHATTL